MSGEQVVLGGPQATTLCHCWRVTCVDGLTLGFTDTDEEVAFDAAAFAPNTGLNASEVRESAGLAVDSSEVEGILSAASVTEDDIRSGRFDGAAVETWLVDWTDPSQRRLLRRATIGEISLQGGRFVATLEGLAAPLDRSRGRFVRRNCDAEFGDQACTVDLDDASWHSEAVVTETGPGRCVTVAGSEGYSADWFENGLLRWTADDGRARTVRIRRESETTDGRRLELDGTGLPPAAGTACTLIAGCDKLFATCRDRFGNGANFQGFPHLPGNDVAYSYVLRGTTPLDGEPVVE